jgi:hypothetical protein
MKEAFVRFVVLVATLLLSGCTAADERPPPPVATGCTSAVLTDALPTWARTGFSGDGSGVPHVLGRDGQIVAVLFGRTLSAPPAPAPSNKILWVARTPATMGDTLRITARLDGTNEQASREVAGGPGPSIIDMPRPGCWHFTLSWSGHTEAMDLTYYPYSSSTVRSSSASRAGS